MVRSWGRRSGLLILCPAVVCVLFVGGCSSKASSKASGTVVTTASASLTRCAAYRALSDLDLRSVGQRTQLAADWPRLRAALAADYTQIAVLYTDVARTSSGTLRANAQLVAGFMPRSRALVLRSPTFTSYRGNVGRLPGDAQVRTAAQHLNADADRSCGIQMVHPAAPVPTTGG